MKLTDTGTVLLCAGVAFVLGSAFGSPGGASLVSMGSNSGYLH